MAHPQTAVLPHSTATASKSKVFTITAHVARVLLGALFLVFGLNGFFQFLTMPAPAGKAGEFLFGLVKGQYLFPFMGFIQVVSGALLLSGFLVPLALLLLFPISLNIFLFHLTLAPEGIGMAFFVMAAHVLLAVYYWPAYKSIFNAGNAWKSKSGNTQYDNSIE